MSNLNFIDIPDFITCKGKAYADLRLSYESFGKPLGTAPIVVVNHALTGNSTVTGSDGWWNDLIGSQKLIDTNIYSVVAFNVPGNGYDGSLIDNYLDFIARDAARIINEGLKKLEITNVFAVIGGSVGGGIAWEMAVLEPELIQHLIPIASDWKSTDWLIANCRVQDQILTNSSQPLQDARMHAMLCYRSQKSLEAKFGRSVNEEKNLFNVETWLLHHGNKLEERFELAAYKLLNNLLRTIDITSGRGSFVEVVKDIKSDIHMIGINSDIFFTPDQNRQTLQILKEVKENVYYEEIDSIHGHDAFLIEFKQLHAILSKIFKPTSEKNYVPH
ncbi:alpha/beta fold hydrolase [Ascidiimonas sp. W6]|uniref:alpha/beta fold hydrolase n=1 Tax=Ascidiimonas meishanensis TaxID=3128903 RepID=UPI0030EEE365